MLSHLSIRDVVLIDRLELAFQPGLCVLTGETGAGKSILLDALGLALGMRAESRLVRTGVDQASVAAEFALPADHPVFAVLGEQGLAADGLILRRVLGADGRSRAFINDQPVSIALLRQIGEMLVEIHGQFETQGLLNPAHHRDLLDAFGELRRPVGAAAATFAAWKSAGQARREAEERLAKARRDEDYLRHATDELARLDPKPGEEEELAAKRGLMMHGEKLAEAVKAASAELAHGPGVEAMLRGAARHLERASAKAEGRFDAALTALDRAAQETAEAVGQIERVGASIDLDPRHLEQTESRLFALRAAARKHDVPVERLAELRADFEARLAALDDDGSTLVRLAKAEAEARAAYVGAAEALSAARTEAAARLDKAVAKELAPLKLDKAKFVTQVEPLPEADWAEHGRDRVRFLVATNPGTPPGPLDRIASGGELARFMLALKVVLAQSDPVPCLIFDEVDAGTGGAVAAAVGERLARLGKSVQVLVVTHSPQVAALGAHHWQVAKSEPKKGTVVTRVTTLAPDQRQEEIARMLAGAEVTAEARAAASRLLAGIAS